MREKCRSSSDFWPVSNILSFPYLYVLTIEINVIEYRNQNMAVLLNVIAIKVCKMQLLYDL